MSNQLRPPADPYNLANDFMAIVDQHHIVVTEAKVIRAAKSWNRMTRRLIREQRGMCDPIQAVALVLSSVHPELFAWCRRNGSNVAAAADMTVATARHVGLELDPTVFTDVRYASAPSFLRSLGKVGRSVRRELVVAALQAAVERRRTDPAFLELLSTLAGGPVLEDAYFDTTGPAGRQWIETFTGNPNFVDIADRTNRDVATHNPDFAHLNEGRQEIDRQIVDSLRPTSDARQPRSDSERI